MHDVACEKEYGLIYRSISAVYRGNKKGNSFNLTMGKWRLFGVSNFIQPERKERRGLFR
jgi:hypothetical protein